MNFAALVISLLNEIIAAAEYVLLRFKCRCPWVGWSKCPHCRDRNRKRA